MMKIGYRKGGGDGDWKGKRR